MLAILARYKQLLPSPAKSAASAVPPAATIATTSTSKVAGAATTATGSSNATLINELLGDLLLGGAEPETTATIATNTPKKTNVLEDLSDIFSSALAESETTKEQSQRSCDQFQLAGIGDVLAPQVLSATKKESNGATDNGCDAADVDVKQIGALRKLPEIDMLSEKLFQQILPAKERMSSFKRDPEKLTLNDLACERNKLKPAEKPAPETLDDVPLLSAAPSQSHRQPRLEPQWQPPPPPTTVEENKEEIVEAPPAAIKQVKHLSEINIELDNIQGIGEERVMLDDDDMLLCLNITGERPSCHVSVIVISAQNKSRQPVKDFQFEASVKKVGGAEPNRLIEESLAHPVSFSTCSPVRCAFCQPRATLWLGTNHSAHRRQSIK